MVPVNSKDNSVMLRRVSLKNFKLFDEIGITVEMEKITVLIGANGTGKSSVLQALAMFKQSLGGTQLLLYGSAINLGTGKDIVHAQDAQRSLEIGVGAPYRNFDLLNARPRLAPSGVFECVATFSGVNVSRQDGCLVGTYGDQLIAAYSTASGETKISPDDLTVDELITFSLGAGPEIGKPIHVRQSSSPSERASEAHEATRKVEGLLSTVATACTNFFLVPAIRGFANMMYSISNAPLPLDLGPSAGAENLAWLAANVIASEPDLADQVAERLHAVLGGTGRLRHRLTQGQIVTEMANGRTSANLVNEAFGLNQLIVPLIVLDRVPPDSLIGIEEPEIHLHPRAQAALSDLFIDVASHESKQLLLTTHSEHILMGLLAGVANGRLNPDELAVYEFRREGDAARADRLEVNEYGQIEGGLRGFMEVDLDEIGELIRARFPTRQE